MTMLVSSSPPAQAGVQSAIAEVLIEFGAALDGVTGDWSTPVMSALVFGFRETAATLVRLGARAGGHEQVVRLLVERGARLDVADTIWHATPLGWAEHEHRDRVAAYLRAAGAC
jgi:hypothetical protein